MYVTLLRLYLELAESPILFLGLVVLLMASWGLIVCAIVDIAIRLLDVHPDGVRRPRGARRASGTRQAGALARLSLPRTR
jgi:hypothetical protein